MGLEEATASGDDPVTVIGVAASAGTVQSKA